MRQSGELGPKSWHGRDTQTPTCNGLAGSACRASKPEGRHPKIDATLREHPPGNFRRRAEGSPVILANPCGVSPGRRPSSQGSRATRPSTHPPAAAPAPRRRGGTRGVRLPRSTRPLSGCRRSTARAGSARSSRERVEPWAPPPPPPPSLAASVPSPCKAAGSAEGGRGSRSAASSPPTRRRTAAPLAPFASPTTAAAVGTGATAAVELETSGNTDQQEQRTCRGTKKDCTGPAHRRRGKGRPNRLPTVPHPSSSRKRRRASGCPKRPSYGHKMKGVATAVGSMHNASLQMLQGGGEGGRVRSDEF